MESEKGKIIHSNLRTEAERQQDSSKESETTELKSKETRVYVISDAHESVTPVDNEDLQAAAETPSPASAETTDPREFAHDTVSPWKDSIRPSAHEQEDSDGIREIVRRHRKSEAA